jgi:hypothetical protein
MKILNYIVIASIAFASIFFIGGVIAYSDQTQEIHRYTDCNSDGFCRPEVWVNLDNPANPGSIQVDYVPSIDPYLWNITIVNLRNVTVNAQDNYDTRGCLEFFVDCPDTTHFRWLSSQPDPLRVRLITDVNLETFRLVIVPIPYKVTLDDFTTNMTFVEYPDGIKVFNAPAGIHDIYFWLHPSVPLLGSMEFLFILLILWIAFAIIGIVRKSGFILIFASFIGMVLAVIFILPISSIGMLVLLAPAIAIFLVGISLIYEGYP